jgi:poly(A) polymerase
MPSYPALQASIDEVFDAQIGDVSGRGKLGADMREIWMMQPRFDKRLGTSPFSLVEQARFRAGFDFMRLRAEVGEVDVLLADWWQEFSMADDSMRQDLMEQVRQEQGAQRARSPRTSRAPRQPSTNADDSTLSPVANDPQDATEQQYDAETAPKKRRRRRRPPQDRAQ